MASATSVKPEGKEVDSPSDSVEAVPAALPRVAVAYNPELVEPGVAIPGGAFVVAFSSLDFRRLTLEPGLNLDVDPELWAAAKQRPAVQELLHLQAIQEIPLDSTNVPAVAVLKHEPEAKANRLVHACRDLKQLTEWLAIEERQSVRMSLQRRMKLLQEGTG